MAMTDTLTGNASVSETLSDQAYATHCNSAPQTLRQSVEKALRDYFAHLEGTEVTGIYTMVLSEVEAPLLETVMEHVKGNQTRASELLGLNRGTLRKKLKQYDLL